MTLFGFLCARHWIKKKFKRALGYTPDFKRPRSYCEKIQWLKLHSHANDKKVIRRADKYANRNYLVELGLEEHLIELYGCWNNPEEIDWDSLPNTFVVKRNNASGSSFRWFIKDKASLNIKKITAQIKKVC